MFKLILMALSLLLWNSGVGLEKSASAGYDHVFEAAGSGWDPNSSPVPQGGPGWDPNG
jgi:hypothetical protein